MVNSVTNLSKNGLSDWLVQRASALILGVYFLCVMSFLICNPDLDYGQWRGYMSSGFMKVFTIVALIALAGHAWVGLWTVSTDYITTRQLGKIATPLRMAFQAGLILVTVIYVVWGIQIVWGA